MGNMSLLKLRDMTYGKILNGIEETTHLNSTVSHYLPEVITIILMEVVIYLCMIKIILG